MDPMGYVFMSFITLNDIARFALSAVGDSDRIKPFATKNTTSSMRSCGMYKVGPLPVISLVITPFIGVITPVTNL